MSKNSRREVMKMLPLGAAALAAPSILSSSVNSTDTKPFMRVLDESEIKRLFSSKNALVFGFIVRWNEYGDLKISKLMRDDKSTGKLFRVVGETLSPKAPTVQFNKGFTMVTKSAADLWVEFCKELVVSESMVNTGEFYYEHQTARRDEVGDSSREYLSLKFEFIYKDEYNNTYDGNSPTFFNGHQCPPGWPDM